MTRVTTATAGNSISETVNRVASTKERIVLTRRGRDVAALVPVEGLRLLEELEEAQDVREAIKALQEPGGKSLKQLRAELGQ